MPNDGRLFSLGEQGFTRLEPFTARGDLRKESSFFLQLVQRWSHEGVLTRRAGRRWRITGRHRRVPSISCHILRGHGQARPVSGSPVSHVLFTSPTGALHDQRHITQGRPGGGVRPTGDRAWRSMVRNTAAARPTSPAHEGAVTTVCCPPSERHGPVGNHPAGLREEDSHTRGWIHTCAAGGCRDVPYWLGYSDRHRGERFDWDQLVPLSGTASHHGFSRAHSMVLLSPSASGVSHTQPSSVRALVLSGTRRDRSS